eukprot:7299846-Prymnesium_polylepis.1
MPQKRSSRAASPAKLHRKMTLHVYDPPTSTVRSSCKSDYQTSLRGPDLAAKRSLAGCGTSAALQECVWVAFVD